MASPAVRVWVVWSDAGFAAPAASSAASAQGCRSEAQGAGPQRVSSGVQAAKLIKHPTPLYPPIAKSARIQGTVVLQAIIGKDGTMQNLKMISRPRRCWFNPRWMR